MTEIEVPLEAVQEQIEHAAHGSHHDNSSKRNWITWSALLSAFLAVAAAVAALQAGARVNEAMISQMHASDTWAYYQAKSIKQNITESRLHLLKEMGKEEPAELRDKLQKYDDDEKALRAKAEGLERESEAHFAKHEIFAQAVTFFQIAIAVTAIAVLAGRRRFLGGALLFGICGLFFLVKGFVPTHQKAEAAAEAPDFAK